LSLGWAMDWEFRLDWARVQCVGWDVGVGVGWGLGAVGRAGLGWAGPNLDFGL
jgi:hypothetical protein